MHASSIKVETISSCYCHLINLETTPETCYFSINFVSSGHYSLFSVVLAFPTYSTVARIRFPIFFVSQSDYYLTTYLTLYFTVLLVLQ